MASSLSSLGAKKAVEQLSQNPDDFAEAFSGFPPEHQTVLLKQMSKRISDLLQKEKELKELEPLKKNMPPTDLKIYLMDAELESWYYSEDEDNGDVETYEEQERMRTFWKWGRIEEIYEEMSRSPESGDNVEWDYPHSLIAEGPDVPFFVEWDREPGWHGSAIIELAYKF
ncbi:hypothetical protein FKW77_003440 [Venturia effusa]|uniref:Uncharacterized protein n=1 Tax=Venturia effusa TaxID=50376 RepID=A0A517LAP6_9PEZI|nr:hypothetical protein FKW77_003440 [Venturia effusa]